RCTPAFAIAGWLCHCPWASCCCCSWFGMASGRGCQRSGGPRVVPPAHILDNSGESFVREGGQCPLVFEQGERPRSAGRGRFQPVEEPGVIVHGEKQNDSRIGQIPVDAALRRGEGQDRRLRDCARYG